MKEKRINHSKVKATIKVAKTPSRKTSQQGKTALDRKIIEVRERCGLLNNELCELLSNELGSETPISAATLHKWITNPSIKTRKYSEEQINKALDSIDREYGKEGYSSWVDGAEVATTIAKWQEYLSKSAIAKKIGISRQTLGEWSKGETKIARKRWSEILDIMNGKSPAESKTMSKHVTKPRRDEKVGYNLIRWIEKVAASKGLDSKATAEALGITYGYWMNLKDGFSKDSVISRRFAETCSNFLNASVLSVFIASDSIRLHDFMLPNDNLLSELDKAIESIEKDKKYSAFISEDIRTINYSLKYLLIILYEKAAKRKLLPESLHIDALEKSLIQK